MLKQVQHDEAKRNRAIQTGAPPSNVGLPLPPSTLLFLIAGTLRRARSGRDVRDLCGPARLKSRNEAEARTVLAFLYFTSAIRRETAQIRHFPIQPIG
jgi:hypothetical protein